MAEPTADTDDLRHGLRALGLSGRTVCVHSSLRSFGHLEGGPAGFVTACLQEGCTVLVPTFSWDAYLVAPPEDLRPPRNGTDYTWQPVPERSEPYTPTSDALDRHEMGAIPAAVLDHLDHVRGDNPLCSFAAVGELAAQLIGPQTWDDTYAPLRALCRQRGAVLLAGVDLTAMTLLHLAELDAGRQPFQRWARTRHHRVVAVPVGGCSDGFEQLRPVLQHHMRSTHVGSSHWESYDAAASLEAATQAIEQEPETTVCSERCERCLEARDGGPIIHSS